MVTHNTFLKAAMNNEFVCKVHFMQSRPAIKIFHLTVRISNGWSMGIGKSDRGRQVALESVLETS